MSVKDLKRKFAGLATLCAVAMFATPAVAADPDVFDANVEKGAADKKKDPGWEAYIDLGASLALSSVNNVVGKTDGISLTLSAAVSGGVNYIKGIHDWRNKLSISLAFTQSPALPDFFVKSTDKFDFDSVYYLRLVDWVGPFARLGLSTQMLPGTDIRPGLTTFKVDDQPSVSAIEFDLTDPFQPLTLKQSLGAFFRPYTEKEAEIEFRAGVGAREVFADGQLTLADDDATADVIEVKSLTDSIIVGGELRAQIGGALEKGRVSYSAHAEFLLPFYDSVADDRGLSFADSINYDFGAKLSFKLVEWASLDYEFSAIYQPQVVEEWQVTNTLLLTFGWGYRTSEADSADEAKK